LWQAVGNDSPDSPPCGILLPAPVSQAQGLAFMTAAYTYTAAIWLPLINTVLIAATAL
jgi:hypothetical protein